MFTKILTAAALSLCMGATAFAQSSGTTGTGTSGAGTSGSGTSTGSSMPGGTMGTLPSGWSGDIGNAFFTDASGTTVRSEAEIRTNWQSLSTEQQAQVRADCQRHASASGGTGTSTTGTTGSGAGVSSDTTASTTTGTGAASSTTGLNVAAIEEVCDLIPDM